MCLFVCFEAGRFTQTQSSRTVVMPFPQMDVWSRWLRLRRWPNFKTDPIRQIRATVTPSTSTLREILPLGPGRGVFSLTSPYHGRPTAGGWVSGTLSAVQHPFGSIRIGA